MAEAICERTDRGEISSPDMPIICSTAARRENLQLDETLPSPDAFLYKPFEARELRELISSLVGA